MSIFPASVERRQEEEHSGVSASSSLLQKWEILWNLKGLSCEMDLAFDDMYG